MQFGFRRVCPAITTKCAPMDEGARARRGAGRFGRAARAVAADASLRQTLVVATQPTAQPAQRVPPKPASDSIAADLAADLAAVSGHSATSERQRAMASIQTGGPDGVTLHGIELRRRYAGDRDPAGLRHSKGRYEFPNPAYTYEGDFHHGRKHGVGTFTTPNGGRYVGEFVDDEITGRGERAWGDGARQRPGDGRFSSGWRLWARPSRPLPLPPAAVSGVANARAVAAHEALSAARTPRRAGERASGRASSRFAPPGGVDAAGGVLVASRSTARGVPSGRRRPARAALLRARLRSPSDRRDPRRGRGPLRRTLFSSPHRGDALRSISRVQRPAARVDELRIRRFAAPRLSAKLRALPLRVGRPVSCPQQNAQSLRSAQRRNKRERPTPCQFVQFSSRVR